MLFSTIALAIYTISINKKINDKIDESKLSKETEVTDELKPTTDMSTEEPEEDDEDFGEFEEITGSLTQDLNFRSGPGYEYETIGTIPRGTEVSGYIDKSGWLKIEYNGQTGYIGPQYVE
ncbi:SH3 domain-containing protein [Miniphocaeibacter halophilus]|uniref:SH3 domain-containing protein n=1 Tax=Miniphocaeibacter halophilus TaxID=2931922 RepID=A0AC61MWI9_9FIRM|nr:SH3 domain-containing protein [Miniphocaeibacter halophilus]QQK08759.1 SH3 domain-containing protein [Miniphocaeibacter halophilus]